MAATAEKEESGYYSSSDQSISDVPEIVQGLARMDLNDDGRRNWQEEAEKYLERYYSDWENPNTVYTVPPVFKYPSMPDPGSMTEEKIYNLLQEFGESYKQPMFVVHSHRFKEHIDEVKSGCSKDKNWLGGEHDFVIIHRQFGLIFLQVKAAAESLKEFKTAQQQIEKDRDAIKIFLAKVFDDAKRPIKMGVGSSVYRYPGFVVMPNYRRPNLSGTAVAYEDAIFLEDCTNVESFHSWWKKKVENPMFSIDVEVYKQLLIRFVALTCVSPSLNYQIDHCHRQIVKFHTPEQLKVMMDSCPKQWITGPAGSGKTVLLVDKVRQLAGEIIEKGKRERILVLCYNRPLCQHLRKTINFRDVVDVATCTYDGFLHKIKGAPDGDWPDDQKKAIVNKLFTMLKSSPPSKHQQFEHIFVDEGQDFYGDHWYELLDLYHNDTGEGCGRYYFWVMFDNNQHVQLSSTASLPWKHLKNSFRLTRVLRNTKNIFEVSKKHFTSFNDSEIELGHNEVGLIVHWEDSLDKEKMHHSSILTKRIKGLSRDNVQQKDIAILTRDVEKRNELMISLENAQLQCQTAEDGISTDADMVIVESVRRFKGLESKVVILFDPQYAEAKDCAISKVRELLYTAVSRCFCYLIIVSTARGCKALKSREGILTLSSTSSYTSKAATPSTSADQFVSVQTEDKARVDHLLHNPYGKRSTDTRYESGPPESPSKRRIADYSDDESDVIPQSVQLSASEEKQLQVQYMQRQIPNEGRPLKVEGSDLLEPGDMYINDTIRSRVFDLMNAAVASNLHVDASPETQAKVKAVVASIEHGVYCKHRKEHNSRQYTKELRSLKAEIDRCNKQSKNCAVVWEAYKKLG